MTRTVLIRTLLVVTLVGVVGLGALLVLARTQVGRAAVARQLEAAFERQFEGTLAVERLTGNLLFQLYGSGVTMRDPAGAVVLRADSVVLRPSWRSLLRGDVVLRHTTLIRPHLDLTWHADGSTNLAAALRPRSPRTDQPADAPMLDLSGLRVVGGSVTTQRRGAPLAVVRDGWLFDAWNARLTDLDATVSLRVEDGATRLRLRRVRAVLPERDVAVVHLEGRLVIDGEGVRGDDLRLALGNSRLDGAFAYGPAGLTLRLPHAELDGAEVQHLVPSYPLRGRLVAEARLEGPFEALAIERLRLEHGRSAVLAAGQVALDREALAYDVALDPLVLHAADVRSLWPEAPDALAETLDRLRLIDGRTTASGRLAWRDGFQATTDARLALATDAGRLDGRLRLDAANDAPLRYVLDADVRNLDPGLLAGDPALDGSLSGHVFFEGAGPAAERGQARLRLGASRLGTTAVEALDADLTWAAGRVSGEATVLADGRLSVTGTADLRGGLTDLALAADGFDLRRLLPTAPATRLTGGARLTSEGRTSDLLRTDLALALTGSTLTLGDSTWALPSDSVRLVLRPVGSGEPRLRLATDAVVLEADGDFAWAHLTPLALAWGERLAAVGRAEAGKRLRPDTTLVALALPGLPDRPAQAFTARLTALRPHGLQPLLPEVAAGSVAVLRATLDPEALALDASVDAERLDTGGPRFAGLDVDLRLRVRATDDPLDGLDLALTARADTLRGTGAGPLVPSVSLRRTPDRRAFALTAAVHRPADSLALALDGELFFLADRTRFALHAALDSPAERWAVRDGIVHLYADALVFEAFEAHRVAYANGNGTTPTLALRGTASAHPADTLGVRAGGLDLGEVLALTGLPLPFDGRLTADLAVVSAFGQPQVLGSGQVAPFLVWGRDAGVLTAYSAIEPGSEALGVDLRVRPARPDAPIRNDLRLVGRVRFPGLRPDGTRDAGLLDLQAHLQRLDLFFFDALFPSVVAGSTGGASGSGAIRGDFRFPLFEAALRAEDGAVTIPDFNLALGVRGDVSVGREGIRLHDVEVRDKAGGRGRIGGLIGFNEYDFFSFDLAAVLSEMEIIDVDARNAGTLPFYGRIRASGTATFTGPLDNVFLHSADAVTTPDSEIFIPVTASGPAADAGFLVFARPDGTIPEPELRRTLVSERPDTERPFLDGLEMSLNVRAPSGSTVHLVFDPVIGDVINAVGSAELQLAILEGEFRTYGTFVVERGDYLFTAGDVFTRRFELAPGGTLTWDGDPIDAQLDLPATYRTRASLAGLGLDGVDDRQRVPVIIDLDVGGHVTGPLVALSVRLDEAGGRGLPFAEALRLRLNEPDRQAEYATSVLLTNTFLLAPSDGGAAALTRAADDLFYTSLSELVSTRLNRFLNQALDADFLDVAVGVQQGSGRQDLDLTYGVALRLLDERLVIRGEGVYQQLENRSATEALQGELAVEVRLGPAVALEVFYRREGDPTLGAGLTSASVEAYGAGVTYRSEFTSWGALWRRLFRDGATPEAL